MRIISSENYLSRTGAVVTAPPATFAVWATRPASLGGGDGILCVYDPGTDSWFGLTYGNGTARAISHHLGVTGSVDATAAPASGALAHFCAVHASTVSRSAYFNGSHKATDTTSVPPSVNTTGCGVLISSTYGTQAFPNGGLAEAVIYNVALTDGEVLALARRVDPLLVRPQNIVALWRIFGHVSPEPDVWRNRFHLTLTGSPPRTTHPPIFYAT